MILSSLALALLPSLVRAQADTQPLVVNCSAISDHLDPLTHKFVSTCSKTSFCSAPINGTCIPRLCRRDEFPFEYANGDVSMPSMCGSGFFCPDEGSGCKPLVPAGNMCQANRDEQCAPPPSSPSSGESPDLTVAPSFNGAICLHSICMYANVTLSQSCVLDETTYIDLGPNGEEYHNVVTKSNCVTPQLYCEPTSKICQSTKPVQSSCNFDAECEQQNCGSNRLCAESPEKPLKVAPWQYAITVLSVLIAMTVTCVMLTLMHKRHRIERYREIREYYNEQNGLRRAIIALHSGYPSDEKRW